MLSERVRAIAAQLRLLADEMSSLEAEVTGLRGNDVAIGSIQLRVAAHYRVRVRRMLSKDRSQHMVAARGAAMYLSREITRRSFPAIGACFNRDHSTVIYAHKVVAMRIAQEPEFAAQIDRLKRSLRAEESNGTNHIGIN